MSFKWTLRQRRLAISAVLVSICTIFYWAASSTKLQHIGFQHTELQQTESQLTESQPTESQRISATLIALVRNEEAAGMVHSMLDLERTWNHQFNYPWHFFNDVPFTDEFIALTQNATTSKCYYELIPSEHWELPRWIEEARFQQSLIDLEKQGVRYGSLPSYRKMCRWFSGFFYKHPALATYRYYWRVEPNVNFYCPIDYDVFDFMQSHGKTYGFTINAYDNPLSIVSLWPETMKFVDAHPNYVQKNNSMAWLMAPEGRPSDNVDQAGYSTCHFWSNFEIGDMNFFRSEVYETYFDHLDHAGGFFYERWGDAPVHSVAIGLFEDSNNIHWFSDIGYDHDPFAYCPSNCEACTLGFTNVPGLDQVNCMPNWLKYNGLGDGGASGVVR